MENLYDDESVLIVFSFFSFFIGEMCLIIYQIKKSIYVACVPRSEYFCYI